MIRQITDEEVGATLTPELAIQSQRAAFSLPSEVPSRIILHQLVSDSTLFKPAAVSTPSGKTHVGMKVVSVRPNNPPPLPTVPGTILMLDDVTGIVNAIIDATLLTAIRTAAGSAVATMALRGPSKVTETLAVFGAGMQGVQHARHLLHSYPSIKTVYIINRTLPRAESAIAALKNEYPGPTYVPTLLDDDEKKNEAASESDVICLCTNSSVPLFPSGLLKPTAHINGVGSYTPTMQELDAVTVGSCEKIVLDSFEAKPVGDIAMAIEAGTLNEADLSHTLSSLLKEDPNVTLPASGITFFKSVGVASQDIAAAGFLIEALDSA
mmetsp:Transcript_5784/g.10496  ORF Transcript_5784/g.10496 Transcript_5784/m.10496 type:complete len:324 (-) Transcript_5784:58-1029(-)